MRDCVHFQTVKTLRGHRDSAKNYPEVRRCGLTNSDNLLELLKHRFEGGDKNLSTALKCGSFAGKKTLKESSCAIMIRIVIAFANQIFLQLI